MLNITENYIFITMHDKYKEENQNDEKLFRKILAHPFEGTAFNKPAWKYLWSNSSPLTIFPNKENIKLNLKKFSAGSTLWKTQPRDCQLESGTRYRLAQNHCDKVS